MPFAASPNGRLSTTQTSAGWSTRSLTPVRMSAICAYAGPAGVGLQICRRRPLFHKEDGLAVGVQGEQFTSRLLVHEWHNAGVDVDNLL